MNAVARIGCPGRRVSRRKANGMTAISAGWVRARNVYGLEKFIENVNQGLAT